MSRLGTLPSVADARADGLAPFNFRDMGGWYLLTNEWGGFLMLEPSDFEAAVSGKVSGELKEKMGAQGFLSESMNPEVAAVDYARRTEFRRQSGPSLHMMVLTLRCNQKCHYCHSSVVEPHRTDTDMDLETAKKTVDFIFQTPNDTIAIEFQGGEPELNWPVLKFITRYARMKARGTNRKLIVSLVSNLTLLTEERLDFLLENYVSICTSLDGPPEVHDANRPLLGGGVSQKKVVDWLKRIQKRCGGKDGARYYLPGALMTTTRFSLPHHKAIIDLYRELGLDQVFIRPLSPIGYAKRVWHKIGYTPEEFVEFYEKSLDYVLELNRARKPGEPIPMMERFALVALTKILKGVDPGFMDMRSPTGAVLGCIAYNYDGSIYSSDEARMVQHQGDEMFRLGHVAESSWDEILDHPTTRALAAASTLENQPMCHQCVYNVFCGIDPVYHYETQRNIFGHMPSSGWCRGHMGVFDVIFRKLRDPENRKIFEEWMAADQCRWQENEAVAA